jgi:hypothetical protein
MPHTKAETLLMPACREAVKVILVPEAASKISEIPLFTDSTSHQVSIMSGGVIVILRKKLIPRRNSLFRLIGLLILVVTLNLSPTFGTGM